MKDEKRQHPDMEPQVRKPCLQMFLTIALVAGVVVLYGCGGGSQAAEQPASAEELKTRILEWVE